MLLPFVKKHKMAFQVCNGYCALFFWAIAASTPRYGRGLLERRPPAFALEHQLGKRNTLPPSVTIKKYHKRSPSSVTVSYLQIALRATDAVNHYPPPSGSQGNEHFFRLAGNQYSVDAAVRRPPCGTCHRAAPDLDEIAGRSHSSLQPWTVVNPLWPRSLVLNLACSACFFSWNSIFLSQQFSRNSVFQLNFRPANGANVVKYWNIRAEPAPATC